MALLSSRQKGLSSVESRIALQSKTSQIENGVPVVDDSMIHSRKQKTGGGSLGRRIRMGTALGECCWQMTPLVQMVLAWRPSMRGSRQALRQRHRRGLHYFFRFPLVVSLHDWLG